MENLHGILVFLRVVEAGTLSAAARRLGVSTSAVSAALARLEDRLSARLVNRTTRRLSLTDEGATFYERCKKIISDLEEAELRVTQSGGVPSGTLRVGVPSTLGRRWIVPQLPSFVAEYPAVCLEIVFTDFIPYTMDQDLDVSIQIGELHDSTFAVRRLATSEYIVCGSPAYLARLGTPVHPTELSEHSCLSYRRPRNGRIREWTFDVDGDRRASRFEGSIVMNNHEALVAAAEAGLGLIQVADYYAHDSIGRGSLVEVLEEYKTTGHVISVVFSKQRPFPQKVRVFVDFLAKQFQTAPWATAAEDVEARA